ncbi:MAG TPA: hypothetical protein VFS08_00495 [Gemmatimonadaceae bacterium]|nr:hypothetical protein [Gemmatimonadaceae bacterium]
MAEVLVQFDTAVAGTDGRGHVARVCGREGADGRWEGWIEFGPQDGGPVLRTPRETTQPNRTDLQYWATGLTMTYLTGALARARDPRTPDLRPRTVDARPTYDGPASSSPDSERTTPSRLRPHAVLNPFEVYAQGEEVLREELRALDEGHLRNIARAYDLTGGAEVQTTDRVALTELIVAGVRQRAG